MLESEARTKICPYIFHLTLMTNLCASTAIIAGGDAKHAGEATQDLNPHCIGSGCIMWEAETYYDNGRPVKNDDGTWKMSDRGDCGLKSKEVVLRE